MNRTEEAKKWLREELERLRRAPDLNGCPMTQEWAEQIRVFTVALEAIEAQGDWLCKKPCAALLDEGVCAHGGICEANRVESDTVKGVEIDQFNWISVEERLPDAEQEVRVLCKASWNSCYRYQCQAFYEPKGMLREKSNYGWDYECCSEYSEEDDDYFVNPGWYERIHNWDDYSAVGIADEVTHWMPLPEGPKEDT